MNDADRETGGRVAKANVTIKPVSAQLCSPNIPH
jgi:hypothetical protein